MLRLDTTTRKIQASLGGVVATSQPHVLVSYSDKTTTAYTGGSQVSFLNSTTVVDICAAPAASAVRDIDMIGINNTDTAAVTVTVRYNDNASLYELLTITLSAKDQLIYTHAKGWQVVDATGQTKTTALSGLIAANIANTPSGAVAATTVQAAINELDSDLTAHLNDTSSAHAASAISYAGSSGISATDVEGALDELDTEKAALAGATFTGDVAVSKSSACIATLGNNSVGSYGVLKYKSGAGRYNWLLAAQFNLSDTFEITPSTAAEGDTFNTPALTIDNTGLVTVPTSLKTFKQYVDYTNTATVGAVTINKASGRVNIAAAGTSVVVTNSLVTAASHVCAWPSTNDTTARVTAVVPAAGSFTIHTVETTAQTSFDFVVFNAD